MRLLVSAFACYPGRGSEPGVGWGIANALSSNYHITLLTERSNIPSLQHEIGEKKSVRLIGIPSSRLIRRNSIYGEWLYYLLWQIEAYKLAQVLHREGFFDAVVHLTYVNSWMPSFLGYLDLPFLWCAGTRQKIALRFVREMSFQQGVSELVRNLAIFTIGMTTKLIASRKNTWVVSSSPQEDWGKNVRLIHDVVGGLPADELRDLFSISRRRTKHETFRALSIGRLLGLKGFSMALRAFALFHQKYPQSEYWLIGDGPERRHLSRLASKLKLETCVKFLGWQTREKLFDIMGSCDVLLHPSLHEQFGYVIIEALATGCPVICLDIAGPSLFVNEQVGVKVQPFSPRQVVSDLSEALLLLATDQKLRQQMGEAASLYAQEWSWENVGKKFNSWLEGMVRDANCNA